MKGDVFDPKAVKKALNLVEEYDAVVSTVGGTPADPKADSEGNIALIDACVANIQKLSYPLCLFHHNCSFSLLFQTTQLQEKMV